MHPPPSLSCAPPPSHQVSDDTLSHIFKTILDWHLDAKSFPSHIKATSSGIIAATLDVYTQVGGAGRVMGEGGGARELD